MNELLNDDGDTCLYPAKTWQTYKLMIFARESQFGAMSPVVLGMLSRGYFLGSLTTYSPALAELLAPSVYTISARTRLWIGEHLLPNLALMQALRQWETTVFVLALTQPHSHSANDNGRLPVVLDKVSMASAIRLYSSGRVVSSIDVVDDIKVGRPTSNNAFPNNVVVRN